MKTLMFSEGIEMEHWGKMGYISVNFMLNLVFFVVGTERIFGVSGDIFRTLSNIYDAVN